MVDVIYNILKRPIANEPDKKDIYHVDRAPKDGKVKRVEDDDPSDESLKDHQASSYLEQDEEARDDALDKSLEPDYKGKGKFIDDDGKEHFDFFV